MSSKVTGRADRGHRRSSYPADVRIEDGVISEIGKDLSGDEVLDATGCCVMPGGTDPHIPEMPLHGHLFHRTISKAARGPANGGTIDGGGFRLPNPNQSLPEALQMGQQDGPRRRPIIPSTWPSIWWASRSSNEMAEVVDRGITSFKHFMAYMGSLMVDDDEMFSLQRCADFGALPLVHAENGDIVAQMTAKLLAEGTTGRKAMPIPGRRKRRSNT